MRVSYQGDDQEHICSFPIEHRANWTEVLFSCTCGRSPSEAIRRLKQENDALKEQIHKLTHKK